MTKSLYLLLTLILTMLPFQVSEAQNKSRPSPEEQITTFLEALKAPDEKKSHQSALTGLEKLLAQNHGQNEATVTALCEFAESTNGKYLRLGAFSALRICSHNPKLIIEMATKQLKSKNKESFRSAYTLILEQGAGLSEFLADVKEATKLFAKIDLTAVIKVLSKLDTYPNRDSLVNVFEKSLKSLKGQDLERILAVIDQHWRGSLLPFCDVFSLRLNSRLSVTAIDQFTSIANSRQAALFSKKVMQKAHRQTKAQLASFDRLRKKYEKKQAKYRKSGKNMKRSVIQKFREKEFENRITARLLKAIRSQGKFVPGFIADWSKNDSKDSFTLAKLDKNEAKKIAQWASSKNAPKKLLKKWFQSKDLDSIHNLYHALALYAKKPDLGAYQNLIVEQLNEINRDLEHKKYKVQGGNYLAFCVCYALRFTPKSASVEAILRKEIAKDWAKVNAIRKIGAMIPLLEWNPDDSMLHKEIALQLEQRDVKIFLRFRGIDIHWFTILQALDPELALAHIEKVFAYLKVNKKAKMTLSAKVLLMEMVVQHLNKLASKLTKDKMASYRSRFWPIVFTLIQKRMTGFSLNYSVSKLGAFRSRPVEVYSDYGAWFKGPQFLYDSKFASKILLPFKDNMKELFERIFAVLVKSNRKNHQTELGKLSRENLWNYAGRSSIHDHGVGQLLEALVYVENGESSISAETLIEFQHRLSWIRVRISKSVLKRNMISYRKHKFISKPSSGD